MNKRQSKPTTPGGTAELRRHAEARLRERRREPPSNPDTHRLSFELEVHQIELELQNAALQKTAEELELALKKYTDLYDFAPVGYFSLDTSGKILDANLTGATLLGVERSGIINRRLLLFVCPRSRPTFAHFLEEVVAGDPNSTCEVLLQKEGISHFWASFRAVATVSLPGKQTLYRVTFWDITKRKKAEEMQYRLEVLDVANRELKQEIVRRQTVEKALRQSEQHYAQLFEQSKQMQDRLRFLSRQLLLTQEEERKRISRELHDVIGQTLTGINARLATLQREASGKVGDLEQTIARTRLLVENSVNIIHEFARELRPAVLDDLGLNPALKTFMKSLGKQTGLHLTLSTFAAVEEINGDRRTVLYRVAQEALGNVARHAHASRAIVKIQRLKSNVQMTIIDDGKGFQTERVLHAETKSRLGLLGMRERVEMVGGSLAVQSAPGRGTTIQVQIPIRRTGAKSRRKKA